MVGVLICCELQTSTWRQAFNLCESVRLGLATLHDSRVDYRSGKA